MDVSVRYGIDTQNLKGKKPVIVMWLRKLNSIIYLFTMQILKLCNIIIEKKMEGSEMC